MAAPDAPPATILVADDDALVRTVLRMALSSWGYHVIEAGSAGEVAGIDPQAVIDLAILDVNMPGGSIADSLTALGARGAPPRVLVLSGEESPTPELAARTDGFARKPVDLADFAALVAGLLSGSRNGGDRHGAA